MSKTTFGERWRIVEPLNEGGQAWTYLVENITNSDDQRYVLKRLKNKKRLDRFETEVRAVQTLSHPSIIRILDHDILDSDPYFVMEYCKLGDLESYPLRDRSMIEILKIFQTVCAAVGEAHSKNIIHRDIKPGNILFKDLDVPVISDFGICFVTDKGLERMTETVEQMGPRYFMSPEMADGRAEKVNPTADVYSLGKLLYWMLGNRVMSRENFTDREWDLRDASSPDHSVHQVYDLLLSKSIVGDPAKRFVDGESFAFEVGKVIKTIESGGRFLDRGLQHRCVFCGQGRYAVTDSPHETLGALNYQTVQYLGLSPIDNGKPVSGSDYLKLRVLECEVCGNLQIFRLNNKYWKS